MAIEHNATAAAAREELRDAAHDAYYALVDDAVEIIERGDDVGPKCDQESLKERLGENEEFWSAVHTVSLAHNLDDQDAGRQALRRIVYDEVSGMCQEYARAVVAGQREAA